MDAAAGTRRARHDERCFVQIHPVEFEQHDFPFMQQVHGGHVNIRVAGVLLYCKLTQGNKQPADTTVCFNATQALGWTNRETSHNDASGNMRLEIERVHSGGYCIVICVFCVFCAVCLIPRHRKERLRTKRSGCLLSRMDVRSLCARVHTRVCIVYSWACF